MSQSKTTAVKVSGHIEVYRVDAPGRTLVLATPNMVVTRGLVVLSEALAGLGRSTPTAGQVPCDNLVWYMKIGGRTTGTNYQVAAPTAEDTDIQGTELARILITSRVQSEDGTLVTYRATLPASHPGSNNKDIQDLALFTRGDNDDPYLATGSSTRIFARQVLGPIAKTSEITLDFVWSVKFDYVAD